MPRPGPSLLLALTLTLLCSATALADVVVVSRVREGIERLTHEEVTNIFMGRFRTLPSGKPAQPIDQPAGSATRNIFYQRLINKDQASINAYWSRLYFSGKASPPIQANSQAEVIERLLTLPGAIGYIERNQLDNRLHVVFEFSP